MAHPSEHPRPVALEDDSRHETTDPRVGQLANGTYRILRQIGSGSCSQVFEVEHTRLGKRFALKLLRSEMSADSKAAQRFRREARAIASLANEHVVSVVDSGELPDKTPYLAMELLDGEDLRSLLDREGPLPVRRAVHIAVEACRGLIAVHSAKLVHRDLKPENLFITRRADGSDWCKILDFGSAKMDASRATQQGALIGTIRYMAPEQIQDSSSVGPATDIYALGAILYECLCGRPPHHGSTPEELMFKILNQEAPALSAPAIPTRLVALVASCLEKDPGRRPLTMAALEHQLAAACASHFDLAGGNPTLSEDDRHLRPAKPRSVVGRAFSGLAVAVLGAGLGWLGQSKLSSARFSVAPAVTTASRVPSLVASTAAPNPMSALGGSASNAVSRPESGNVLAATAGAAAASTDHGPSGPVHSARGTKSKTPPAAAVSTGQSSFGHFDRANPYGE